MKDKVWVQAAIDVEDMDVAKRIAWMALDNGAEWLEVGTPLLYKFGYSAIAEIRKAVGKNAVLVADYKCPFAGFAAENAAQSGADFILVSAGYNDDLMKWNLEACRKTGITPIFDLHINPHDVVKRTQQLAEMGVKYLFSHHYANLKEDDGLVKRYDTLQQMLEAGTDIKIGITSDDFEESKHASQNGASWMVFGYVLRDPNPISCRRWINMIHGEKYE